MFTRLVPDPDRPPSTQIADDLRSRTGTGQLAAGTSLPSTRAAAAELGVNRHTVAKAYRDLCEAGLLERTPSGGFCVAVAVAPRATAEEVGRFARDCLRRAAAERIAPDALLAELNRQSADSPARITLVECSSDQCEDLSRQVRKHWVVDVEECVLEETSEPPEGPLLSTLAHVTDVTRRWPERTRDAHFLTAGLSDDVGPILEHVTTPLDRVLLLVDHDLVGGRTLADDLSRATGIERGRFTVAARADASLEAMPRDTVVVATPHAYLRLPEVVRTSPRTVRIRYALAERELEALAAARGWRRRRLVPLSPLRGELGHDRPEPAAETRRTSPR